MSNSSLISYTKLSPNCSARTAAISKITIHHAAVVNGSLEGIGNHFAKSSTQASSNYGIDSNGKIALYVDESKRAWTSSNTANDNVAVTIEVMNSKGAPNWEVSNKAYEALIDLCVDICERNNIKSLNYTGDKNGNLTRHNMFASTTCPGPYLQGKFSDITKQVNERLGSNNSAPSKKPEPNTAPSSSNSLYLGCSGEKVKILQNNLNGLNYNCGTADGSFGSKTKNAVIAFQKAYNLTTDGIAGSITLAKIESVIKDLQTKLNDKGCNCGSVDGIYGNATKSAVIKFQTINKLVADGIAGEKTFAALNKTTSSAPTNNSYKVKVTASLLNIRKGPGLGYGICGQIKDKGVYTIVETKGGWGKLKSGTGWIYLAYTKKA